MKINFSKYQLEKKNALNSKDISNIQEGALIQVVDENHNWGVADLCPWPSLGDLTWQQEILNKGSLFQRSLVLALEDLEARKNKKSLLSSKVIENNFLITQLEAKKIKGSIKIKGTKDIQKTTELIEELSQSEVQIRVDFNACLSRNEFQNFLDHLSQQALSRIEYIEDPTEFTSSDWLKWNQTVPLAVDFVQCDLQKNSQAWSVLIIKPARQDAVHLIEICNQLNKMFTLTSSMDHPVGVVHGLRFAQQYAKSVSGFLTLDLYQATEFHSNFTIEENKISFAKKALDDFGIGMTQELNNQSWIDVGCL